MNLKSIIALTVSIVSIASFAQTNNLKLGANLQLPKDTIISKQLILSLNNLLIAKDKPNEENNFILNSERVETYLLLDEIIGIEKSGKFKDDNFYKPYLMNVVKINDDQYYTQISFIGINENISMLRASFELIAHKSNNSFVFSSPLIRNTKNWQIEKVGNYIFHYQKNINKSKVQEFNKFATSIDKKLKITNKSTEFYCCENFTELQKLIGIEYKNDYNGKVENVFSSKFEDKNIIVLGNNNSTFNEFDQHDLWHDRLSLLIARNLVNKTIDEGCAYIYGGSWGISWEEIFKIFKKEVANNKNANWLEIKENPIYFKTKEFKNSADYIVNALLVQKIEKEKGFAGVWEFLNCGKLVKGNENYFKSLEKLTGITKANYNDKIWELINDEK